MPPAVFISYSHREPDASFARQLIRDLRPYVKSIWFDDTSIGAGRPWDKEIEHGILNADVVLSLLSPNLLASPNCEDEFSFAIGQGKPVIPVWLTHCSDETVWMRLSRLQRIDFRTDYNGGFWRLIEALKNLTTSTQIAAVQTCPVCQATAPLGSAMCPRGHAQRPSSLGELFGLQTLEISRYLNVYQPRALVATAGADDLMAVALSLLAMRNYDAAIPLLQRAITVNPIHAYGHYALALASLRLRRPFLLGYDEAVQIQTLVSNALAYKPDLAPAAFLLALIKEDFFTKHGYRVNAPSISDCLNMARGGSVERYEVLALTSLLADFSSPVMNAIRANT